MLEASTVGQKDAPSGDDRAVHRVQASSIVRSCSEFIGNYLRALDLPTVHRIMNGDRIRGDSI